MVHPTGTGHGRQLLLQSQRQRARPAVAHEDTVVIEIYDGPHYAVKPDWYTDERDAR
jgi:hypothetical protein